MLAKQLAELRERLAKTLAELEELKGSLENLVPRCVLNLDVCNA
jgi:hypothetical protein